MFFLLFFVSFFLKEVRRGCEILIGLILYNFIICEIILLYAKKINQKNSC